MSFMKSIDNTQDVNLAMEVAGHDFEVVKGRLNATVEDSEFGSISIPDHVAILNKDTGQYLGTVGHGWEPVQPKTLYELAQELISSTNGTINGVFNMHGGSVIGIQFHLADREYIAGDKTELNFVMLTAFNGTHGIAGHSTTHRLVCMNQCNTSSKIYNLKHTKNVLKRVEVVKNILKYYNNEILSFDEIMKNMVRSRMNDNAAVEWFKSLFPEPTSERSQNILNNQVSIFVDCLHNGQGSSITGVKGTCYGAFQALTEYINHHRAIRVHNNREEAEVRFQTVHFGTGNTLAQKGMRTISQSFSEFGEDEFKLD